MKKRPRELTNDCAKILGRYNFDKRLGEGEYGVVFRATSKQNNQKKFAIKFLAANERASIQEVEVSQEIETKLANIFAFTKIFASFKCSMADMPEEWYNELLQYNNKLTDEFYVLILEFVDGPTVSEYNFKNLDECRKFLFILIVSLQEARTKDYFHYDLHDENVMVVTNDPEGYMFRHNDIVFQTNIYPKIIDYGFSSFKRSVHADESRSSWLLNYTSKDFWKNNRELIDIYKLLYNMTFNETNPMEVQDWIKNLLEELKTTGTFARLIRSKLFDGLGDFAKEPVPKKEKMCVICNRIATQVYKHAPHIAFCSGKRCPERMGPMGYVF